MEFFAHPAVLVAFGFVVGFFGALVGVGGGFLIVPYGVTLLAWTHLRAIGTSLAIVVTNAASAVLGYSRQRRIDFRLALLLAVGTLPGTFLGRWLATYLTGPEFKIAFATLIILVALYLAFTPREVPSGFSWCRQGWKREILDRTGTNHRYDVNPWFAFLVSIPVGVLATLFGVGGGFLHVPIMILLLGIPPHIAAATSTFALAITSTAGALQYTFPLGASHVDWITFLYAGCGAFAGAQLGTMIAPRIPARGLRLVLATVLILVGARLAWNGMTGEIPQRG